MVELLGPGNMRNKLLSFICRLTKKYGFSVGGWIAFVAFGLVSGFGNAAAPLPSYFGLFAVWNLAPLILLESFSGPSWARLIYKVLAGLGFIWEMMLLYGVFFQDSQGDAALGFIFTPIYIGGFALFLFLVFNGITAYWK
jgi:hypothetical protein